MVLYTGLTSIVVLKYFKIHGSILFSIIIASVAAHLLKIGINIEPIQLSREMFQGILALDFGIIFNPKIWSIIIILFILDFYGSIAKFIGLTRNTNIVDEQGNLPKMKEALIVDSAGTLLGATTGTSNLITYVESAVGIGEGGRTGLVAVVIAILMSLFLFLTPILNLIPVIATTGALVFVGTTLFPKRSELKTYNWIDVLSIIGMIIATVWTFGLDKAMFVGFALTTLLYCLSGKWRQINLYLVISTIILFTSIILSK